MRLAGEFGETATAVSRDRFDEEEAEVRWGRFAAFGITERKAGRREVQKVMEQRKRHGG